MGAEYMAMVIDGPCRRGQIGRRNGVRSRKGQKELGRLERERGKHYGLHLSSGGREDGANKAGYLGGVRPRRV